MYILQKSHPTNIFLQATDIFIHVGKTYYGWIRLSKGTTMNNSRSCSPTRTLTPSTIAVSSQDHSGILPLTSPFSCTSHQSRADEQKPGTIVTKQYTNICTYACMYVCMQEYEYLAETWR